MKQHGNEPQTCFVLSPVFTCLEKSGETHDFGDIVHMLHYLIQGLCKHAADCLQFLPYHFFPLKTLRCRSKVRLMFALLTEMIRITPTYQINPTLINVTQYKLHRKTPSDSLPVNGQLGELTDILSRHMRPRQLSGERYGLSLPNPSPEGKATFYTNTSGILMQT